MKKGEFINRVLLIMNEAGMMDAGGNAYLGAENTQVDRHIEGTFVDAWRRCIKVMPRMWFKNASFITNTKKVDLPDGTGYIILPDDFYLLTSFKMRGWKKAVHEASLENERTSSVQSNEYTRGSEIRPICTISMKSTTEGIKNVLNYYSLRKGLLTHVVEEALYVPVVTSIKDLGNDAKLNLSAQDYQSIYAYSL